jgi:hypothetical protein
MRAMPRLVLTAAIAGGLTSVAAAQSITTLFASDNGGSAGGIVFFDVTTGPNAIDLTSFDVNTAAPIGSNFGFTLYTHIGTYLGTEQNAGAWSVVATGVGVGAGENSPSHVVTNLPVSLQPNTTYGVAIVLASTGQTPATHEYTNGNGTNQMFSNPDLTLTLGAAQNVPFTGAPFTPRVWNGTINYAPSNPNATGACCFSDGTCAVITPAACSAQGGSFGGIDVTCAQANCPQPSRCCLPDLTCTMLTQSACLAQGGAFTANSTCASACPALSTVFAVDVRSAPHRLLSFPVTAPANTPVSNNVPVDIFAMDFNGAGTTLYAIQYNVTAPSTLGTLDTTTGAFTAIAPISGAAAGEANMSGLSFDASNNTWYALGATGAGVNTLYTLDIATGNTTLVGPLNDPAALFIDLAVDNNGNMFTHDIVSDALYSVNKTTGAATLIGATGFAANFAQGMDFDPATNTLYATIYTGGGAGSFVSIDTATGAGTLIADTTSWNAEMEMAIRGAATGSSCYANCDHSTTEPRLNVLDFNCFLNEFSAGHSYANCDHSTTEPTLNVLDFNCFLNSFSAGCSNP